MYDQKNFLATDLPSALTMDVMQPMMPISKLDADQYMAEDIDGVSESLSGSGNLNFLIMQLGQVNQAIDSRQMLDAVSNQGFSDNSVQAPTINLIAPPALAGDGYAADNMPLDTDRAISDDGVLNTEINHGQYITGSTLSSLSVGALQLNSNSSHIQRAVPGGNGNDGIDGGGQPGVNGINGNNGSDGNDGQDGSGGGDIINIENNEFIDIDIENVFIDLGDVTTLITISVTEITDITNTVIYNIFDILDNPGGLTIHLDAILSGITNLNLDLINGDTTFNLINQAIDLTPVTDLLNPIINLETLQLVDAHSIISLLGSGDQDHRLGDTDLGIGLDTVLGDLELTDGVVDVAFNPVEDLVGDIDILGDLNLSLLNNAATDNNMGDQDIVGGIDLNLSDSDFVTIPLNVELDPIEQVIGDVDLDLGIAADILNDTADGLVDDIAGGSGVDSLLSDLGDSIENVTNPLIVFQDDPADTDVTSDINIAGFDENLIEAPASVVLDPVEMLIGDIDSNVDPTFDLLGEFDSSANDSDLDTNIDINLLGQDVVEVDFIDIEIDPIEHITGDIDLNIDAALDLINNADVCSEQLAGNLLGDNDILESWPENTVPPSDLIDHSLGGALDNILPEPVGHIAEGLGALDIPYNSDGGGLFGGGLFG